MGILRSLCCFGSAEPDPPTPGPSQPSPEEKNKSPRPAETKPKTPQPPNPKGIVVVDDSPPGDPPDTPTPSSQFIQVLADNPDTLTRQLLQPYVKYELWLRKVFARGHPTISPDGLANLVPIYDGHQNLVTIRGLDRKMDDKTKYIMPVPEDDRLTDGALAIAPSMDEYNNNFLAFTHGILAGLDWTNVVAAGSSALLPLLSFREDVDQGNDPSVAHPLEAYYETIASSSDIDLFIYGIEDEEAAIKRIFDLETQIRKNQRLLSEEAMALRTEHAITFISPRYPYRHVQIILRLYKSISEILTGFDVDCACVAFDGKNVYSNPRGVAAIATRTNTIDLTRRSPSYENRLFKYRNHGFDVYWENLERSRVQTYYSEHRRLTGLSRLILFEEFTERYKRRQTRFLMYQRRRKLKKIADSWDPILTAASGYATLEIPYGERFTATSIRKYVDRHSNDPHFFGTINDVVVQGMKRTKKNQGKLSGKVTFIKDDPGRQLIGSFHPITDDDWTRIAYEEE